MIVMVGADFGHHGKRSRFLRESKGMHVPRTGSFCFSACPRGDRFSLGEISWSEGSSLEGLDVVMARGLLRLLFGNC